MTKKFPGHGTVYAYNDFSCRCDLCKAAAKKYQHEHYLNKKKELGQ